MLMKDYFNLRKSTGWHRGLQIPFNTCLYIFALLAMMAGGVSPAWADTLTENFNGELPSGWSIVGDLSHNSDRARSGKGIWTSSKSDNANYLVTEAVEGSITFYARAYNKNMAAYVFIYKYDGATLGDQLYTTGDMKTSSTPSWSSFTANLGTYKGQVAIALNYAAIDDVTYTQKAAAQSGPKLTVTGDKNGKLAFGVVDAGATKTLTMANPGSEAITLDITKTGNFGVSLGDGVSLTGVTLNAFNEENNDNEKTLTITATAESTEGTVTITPNPEVDGIDPVTVNLSCIIKDDRKFVNFSDGLPEGWTKGSWTVSTTGGNNEGGYIANNTMSAYRIYSNKMTFAEGEKLSFAAKRGNSTYAEIQVQYSTNGSDWTTAQTISATELDIDDWDCFTVDVPTGDYYIGFYGRYCFVTDIYGGEDKAGANFEISPAVSGDQNFGRVKTNEIAEKEYTIINSGAIDLPVAFTDATDFYVAKTVMFTKPDSWTGDKLYMYAWDSEGHALNGVWPGYEVTKAAQNDMSQWVYTASLPKGATGIKFSDNASHETGDISTADFKDIVGLWLDGSNITTWKNDDFIVPAGGSATFIVRMDTKTTGAKSGSVVLTFDALNATGCTITCKGNVVDPNYLIVDFDDPNAFPEGWQVGADWSIATASGNSYAVQSNTKTASALVTTPLNVAEGETLTFKAARNASAYGNVTSLKTRYSTDGGATWSSYVSYNVETSALTAQTVSGIPAGTIILEFFGSNIKFDDIEGFTKTNAAAIALAEGTADVANGDTKDFGFLNANGTATYTVKNIGNATLKATIAGEGVNVEPASIEVAAGETKDIVVTMAYAEPYTTKTAKMTIDSEDWVGDFVVNFTAELVDPSAFVVDFESGKPAGWYSEAWTFDNSVAYVNNGVEKPMITELLAAEEGKNVLSFDAFSTYDSQVLNVYTSADRKEWTLAKACNLTATSQTFTLSALADGNYYIKFGGALATTVDNIKGLKKLDAPAHDLYLVEGGATLPTADITPIDTYTASVKVASLRADEKVTADLYFGDTKVATATKSVATGATETITVEGKAPTAGTFEVYVKVNAGKINDETEKVCVTVADVTELTITAFAAEETNIAADENNDFTATFNVTVKNNGSTNIPANNVSVSVIDNANAENVYTATWDASTSDVLYMNSSNGTDDIASDNAKLGVWMWGNSAGEWGTFTKINDGFYSVNLKGNTGFIIVRTASDKEFNLDDCWNKTGDMSLSNGNLVKFNGYSGATINFDSESMTMLEPTMSTTLKVTVTAPAGDGGNFAYKAKENVTNTEWNDGYGETTVTVKVTAATIVLDEAVGTVLTGTNRKVQLKHSFVEGWNTICLPFSIEAYRIHMQAKALAFTAYDSKKNELTFSPATTLEAGKPYVIYVPAAITEPMEFTGVTIASTEAGMAKFNDVTFQGTFAPIADGSLEGKWGLTAAGKIAKADENTKMKGFRAYFDGISVGATARFLDDLTGISTITADGVAVEGVYNLQGQKVEQMKKGGLYIINGKKVKK